MAGLSNRLKTFLAQDVRLFPVFLPPLPVTSVRSALHPICCLHLTSASDLKPEKAEPPTLAAQT